MLCYTNNSIFPEASICEDEASKLGARTIEVVGQPCASAGVPVPLTSHGLRFESVFSHLGNPTTNKKAQRHGLRSDKPRKVQRWF